MNFLKASSLLSFLALLVFLSPVFAEDKDAASSGDEVTQLRVDIKQLKVEDALAGKVEKKAEENEKIVLELVSSL